MYFFYAKSKTLIIIQVSNCKHNLSLMIREQVCSRHKIIFKVFLLDFINSNFSLSQTFWPGPLYNINHVGLPIGNKIDRVFTIVGVVVDFAMDSWDLVYPGVEVDDEALLERMQVGLES